ncbi:hypothetical protein VQH23_09845 [Pararoseomonas sp. SCSIO 73927]|uniref:hypothetical protein n=1 Tax=Pararoseomonas sp. SCSIO 73927 TaxID=3114537 RepID=UPI0030CCF10C
MPSHVAVEAVEDLARYARAHALEDAESVLMEIMALLMRPSRRRAGIRISYRHPVGARVAPGAPDAIRVSIQRLRRRRQEEEARTGLQPGRVQSGRVPSDFSTSPAK